MTRQETCARITEIGVVPAIRVSSRESAYFAAEAVTHGGVPIVEITLPIPGAVDLIADLVREPDKMLVGAGTVLDVETARQLTATSNKTG